MTFLAVARWRDQPRPRFIEQELGDYLRCGVLAFGISRAHSDDCGLGSLRSVLVQTTRLLSLLQRAAHGCHRGAPGGLRLPEVPVRQ